MKARLAETGPLRVFQLFAGVQLALLLTTAVPGLFAPDAAHHSAAQITFMLVATAALFGYLLSPGLARRLGVACFPLAIGLSLCAPIVGQALLTIEGRPFSEYLDQTPEMALFSLFPLLAAGWRYRFRVVAALAVGVGLADLGLTKLAYPVSADAAEYDRSVLVRTLGYLAIGFVLSRLTQQQRLQHRALQRANASLAHYAATLEQLAVSRERGRLAREPHDTLAHTLSGVAVQLEGVRALFTRSPQQAAELLGQALASTRSGLVDTRRALQDLRAMPLEELGLCLAVEQYARKAADRCGAALELDLPDALPRLPPDVDQGVYRVAQEALENAAKHAEARLITVRLRCEVAEPTRPVFGDRDRPRRARRAASQASTTLVLTVVDDGCGFDPSQVADAAGRGHYGLAGLRERCSLIGGEFDVATRPGGGTTVRLSVPCDMIMSDGPGTTVSDRHADAEHADAEQGP